MQTYSRGNNQFNIQSASKRTPNPVTEKQAAHPATIIAYNPTKQDGKYFRFLDLNKKWMHKYK